MGGIKIKIRTKLLLTILFSFVLAVVLVGGVTNFFLLQKTEDSTLDRLDALASIQKNRVNEFLNEKIERLNGLLGNKHLIESYSSYLESNNPNALLNIDNIIYDTLYSDDNFDQIVLYSIDGEIVTSLSKTKNDEQLPALNISNFDSTRQIQLLESEYESHVNLSGPVFINDVIVGKIAITADLEDLVPIVNDYTGMGKTGETFLAKKNVNGDALFITPLRFDQDASFSRVVDKNQVEVPITRALLSQEIKMKDATDYRGEQVLAVTKYIENTEWGLVSKIDKSEVYTSFYEANIIQLGFIIALVGAMLSVSLVVSDRILKPIMELKNKVQEVEKGNYDTELTPMGDNEISSLIDALSSLKNSLKKQKKETKSFEEKLKKQLKAKDDLQNAIDQSSMVLVLDKDGKIIYANKEFEELARYNSDELVGKSHKIIRSGFHPPEFYHDIWNTISSGNVWKGNIKNKSKDGSEFWARTIITPFMGENGIPEQYIIVKTDITELIAQKDLIQRQFKELKNIDVRKEEFASMVSHELKTPITPIKFNTEMLLEPGVLGPVTKDQEDAIKEIEINTQRLENLISDILYAQRLDMNRMVFNKKKFSSGDLLAKISKNLSPLMEEKSIEFEVKDEFSGTITSDEGRIQQILENLVKNSIDFVPDKGGKISMGVKNHNNYAIFYVRDNGIGIPKEKQKNLFKKFYQVDTSHTRKHGGTGLGLVISKGFAEGLGGEIWCESEVGKGSGFYFTIPKNQEIEVKANG